MRITTRVAAIAGFAVGAFFLLGGLIGLVGVAAGSEGDPDLGTSGLVQVSLAYLAVGFVFGGIGLAIWPRGGR